MTLPARTAGTRGASSHTSTDENGWGVSSHPRSYGLTAYPDTTSDPGEVVDDDESATWERIHRNQMLSALWQSYGSRHQRPR